MENKDLLECSKVILNFIIHSDKEFVKLKTFNTPSNISMMKILKTHNTDMLDFTLYLNNKFDIMPNPLWENSATEFFSDNIKSISFYKTIINMFDRIKKINKINKLISKI